MDWLDLLAVQGTLKSLPQHLSSKTSILQCSGFMTVNMWKQFLIFPLHWTCMLWKPFCSDLLYHKAKKRTKGKIYGLDPWNIYQKSLKNWLYNEHVSLRLSQRRFSAGSVVRIHLPMKETVASTPGSGRSPGERNGNPLLYSCLGNPMGGGARRATNYGSQKSCTQLGD